MRNGPNPPLAAFTGRKPKKIVTVSASRTFDDYDYLCRVMDELASFFEITELRQGCAPGGDQLAERWAKSRGITVKPFRARWEKYARSSTGRVNPAGFIRNGEMVNGIGEDGIPPTDVLVAFRVDGSRGTGDAVRKARKRGLVEGESLLVHEFPGVQKT